MYRKSWHIIFSLLYSLFLLRLYILLSMVFQESIYSWNFELLFDKICLQIDNLYSTDWVRKKSDDGQLCLMTIEKNTFQKYSQLLLSRKSSSPQTSDISKVNSLVPENLMGDVSSLKWQKMKCKWKYELCPDYILWYKLYSEI